MLPIPDDLGFDAKLELLELLEEQKRREKYRSIFKYYPDTGPLRRELYPKHIEFLNAGAKYRERACISGNRCLTPWTPIELGRTTKGSSTRQIVELFGEKEFYVRAWDGGSRCNKKASGLFLKGIEPMFLVQMDNGESFQCSRRHRVLTSLGWLSLDQLVRLSSGLSFSETVSSSLANYVSDVHPHDPQLQCVQDIYQERSPSATDVQTRQKSIASPMDASGYKSRCNHAYQTDDRPSIPLTHYQIADLCEQFEDPTCGVASQRFRHVFLECRRLLAELTLSRADLLKRRHLPSSVCAYPTSILSRDDSGTCWSSLYQSQSGDQHLLWKFQNQPSELFLQDDLRIVTFVPFSGPSLVGGNKIEYIGQLDCLPIMDFTVNDVNCYFSGGVIHHNTGKTESLGGYETVLHLTGIYPSFWEGKRFDHPVSAWCAGKTNITVRDILQKKLCGPVETLGTGLIPGDLIVGKPSRKAGVPDAYETIRVKHSSGGISDLSFKSYESGRDGFEGTEKHLIYLDEEPPLPVYTECLIRTMKTGFFEGGIVLCTFTPMEGMSETCMFFLENGTVPEDGVVTETGRYVKMLTWDDAVHISAEEKAELLRSIPPYQREARTKGIPALGSGAIYPIGEEEILVDPFPLPPFWPKCYALDVGWQKTAALWAAWDRESDVVYLYSEHYQGEEKPTMHAKAIKGRGAWIPGVIDPASRGRSQKDGEQLFQMYLDEGLELTPAVNAVEAGIYEVWQRLSTGRLKVFRGLNNFLSEFRLYRRDEKGKIVKKNDHLCDAARYLCGSGLQVARTDPAGDYDGYIDRLAVNDDGFRRAINAIKNADDSNFGLAGTYH